MLVNDSKMRNILILECIISSIASCTYYLTMDIATKTANDIKSKNEINYPVINYFRYIDTAITTPLLIITLILSLNIHANKSITVGNTLGIIILNYIMFYIGYLGDIGTITKIMAMVLGFIPLLVMFFIIYFKYIGSNTINKMLFGTYFAVFSMFNVSYLFNDINRNICINILDGIIKGLMGILFSAHYYKLI